MIYTVGVICQELELDMEKEISAENENEALQIAREEIQEAAGIHWNKYLFEIAIKETRRETEEVFLYTMSMQPEDGSPRIPDLIYVARNDHEAHLLCHMGEEIRGIVTIEAREKIPASSNLN